MAEPVEGGVLRSAMRQVPSAVVVVTAQGRDESRGITIGSFRSVSLDPPLVSFNVGCESRMYDVMESCTHFTVNVLADDQVHLAKRFAIPGISGHQQFDPVSITHDKWGTPVLDGILTALTCEPSDSLRAGDHVIYVGRVIDVERYRDRGPVLYYESAYRGVGSELGSRALSPVKRVSSDSS